MKLSTRSRYGLRAMIFIARNGTQVLSSEVIAENENVSKKYLDRILMRLREANLLRSVKGQGGGYVLARPADEIRTDEIITALEGSLCLVECVDDPSVCDRSTGCPTRGVWSRIAAAVNASLRDISLEDLSRGEDV
ncbi:MAG TPA: Rrf2 family transcriptional regulator [bacterium]|nr:Rrf2 family transcriptional regulator [bacterium]